MIVASSFQGNIVSLLNVAKQNTKTWTTGIPNIKIKDYLQCNKLTTMIATHVELIHVSVVSDCFSCLAVVLEFPAGVHRRAASN